MSPAGPGPDPGTDSNSDPDSDPDPDAGRRAALRRLGAAGSLALAGCLDRSSSPPDLDATTTPGEGVGSLPDRPNIVVIYADDLGWFDTGFQGSRYYDTPHLDDLASRGVQFTDGYANAPNCAPSRACFLTGQYVPRHEVYTVRDPSKVLPGRRRLSPPKNNLSLPTENATIAEVLSAAGYDTALVGKWHLGAAESEFGPTARGFDVNLGGDHFGKLPNGYFPPYDVPNVQGRDGEYLTDRLTDEVESYIADHAGGDPFFLYFAPYSVHTPIQAPRSDVRPYIGRRCRDGQCNPRYGGMVSALNDSVGRVMAALARNGIAEDTLVVFTSDNGGLGDYEEVGLSETFQNVTSQGPLRAGKGTLYEGGIRVPTVVAWPGVLEDRVTTRPVIGSDLFPTFVDLANAHDAVPDDHVVDGHSLVPFFERGDPLDRDLFWHFPAYLAAGGKLGDFRTTPVSVVRSGRWKLHRFYEGDRHELYDLREDVSETENLADERPDIRRELRRRLDDWLDATDARRPRRRGL